MPAVTIIRARGNGSAEPMGERHITTMPTEGEYVTLRGTPYRVEAVIHSLDSNRILLRVREVMSDPEPPREQRPQLPQQRPSNIKALPALVGPLGGGGQQTFVDDGDDDVEFYPQ